MQNEKNATQKTLMKKTSGLLFQAEQREGEIHLPRKMSLFIPFPLWLYSSKYTHASHSRKGRNIELCSVRASRIELFYTQNYSVKHKIQQAQKNMAWVKIRRCYTAGDFSWISVTWTSGPQFLPPYSNGGGTGVRAREVRAWGNSSQRAVSPTCYFSPFINKRDWQFFDQHVHII